MATDRKDKDMQHYYPVVASRRALPLGFVDMGIAPIDPDLAAIADTDPEEGDVMDCLTSAANRAALEEVGFGDCVHQFETYALKVRGGDFDLTACALCGKEG